MAKRAVDLRKNRRNLDSGIRIGADEFGSILKDVSFETSGFLEKDYEDEEIHQRDIASSVDILSAQKYFDLNLDKFGPYALNYTRNGRHLLIGGAKGHVASFDWQTKSLNCEINVMESVNDVKWLHIETMFAVAQRQWTYIYDNQGVELHCLKVLDRVHRLEFLPYHFLLASINATGYLSYIDVSLGKKVAGFSTGHGRCDIMAQNPANAIIHLGHSSGVVTLWSPNVREPLVKMLCHKSPLKSLAINVSGNYMVTSGLDHLLNVWDLRTYKQLRSVRLSAGATALSFSQKNMIAAGLKNQVVVLSNEILKTQNQEADEYIEDLRASEFYLKHDLDNATIRNTQFCPYEDVLAVGHGMGVSSLLVPGSGEPCFDALEANPYESKKQRRQWEVKALLEKIQPELISLDPVKLKSIDQKTLQEKMIERNKKLFLKPRKIDFEPRHKTKGKSKSGKIEARKKAVKNAALREFVKEVKEYERQDEEERQREQANDSTNDKHSINDSNKNNSKSKNPYSVFDRFKKSKKI